jgi:hypothetical protein
VSLTRAISCTLILLAAAAGAQEKAVSPPQPAQPAEAATNIQQNEYSKAALDISNQSDPPKPPSKYRGLKIALGVIGGVALFGAIIGIAVANSSSNNQTGYNDWGTLALMRR